ncbi:MAG: divalent metal cation transporter [Nitrososphaerota archaeon]
MEKITLKDRVRNFGPAWLVMIADIDIASIITGLQAGSVWGYRMVFVMLILTIPLFFVQDAAGRLGIASGMGLGRAVYKYMGRKTAMFAAIPMGISDFLEYVAEYAGIAVGLYLLKLPLIPGLIAVYILHTAIVLGKRYRQAEIFLLPISFVVVAGIALSLEIFHINTYMLVSIGLNPLQPYGDPSFDYLLAASMGAVVMPWMLYFHSGADSRKGKGSNLLRDERLETIIGAFVSEVLMAVIVLVGMNLGSGGSLIGISELPKAISIFGQSASLLLGVGFMAAGFLALVVISLGSAWGVLEALNTETSTSFLSVYIVESIPALLLVVFTTGYLQLILNLMVIYTIIILPSLFLLGRLVSKADVMNGYHYGRTWQIIFWTMSILIAVSGLAGLFSFIP